MTNAQKVRFALLCALETTDDPEFVRWAGRWLDRTDRTRAAVHDLVISSILSPYAARAAVQTYIEGNRPEWVDEWAYRAAVWTYADLGHFNLRGEKIDLPALARRAVEGEQ